MLKDRYRAFAKNKLKSKFIFHFKKDFLSFKELKKIVKFYKAKNILIYIPLEYEINLLRFRRELSKNSNIFVPFMQDKSLKIVKLRLPLYKKRFGVYEPYISFLNVKIDLAVIPVIAVDKNLKRIGHGKGFYDMFFANLAYKPLVVFVQALNLYFDKSLCEKHDIQADFYINPYKKYFKRELKNANNNLHFYSRCSRRGSRIFSC
ncbi:5-formyltetrahydrofolate cyclo-ligase [uncultured Campylobacter sp.]|uniref:5-formyltetrahydrofolate cyclo-ligase n=1 Tax=uncultured Campylobacter sp. TaxID=218934 RepID=UPI00261F29B1|nr:5-formyltetrahydrofolate cyclo-ligase [uncultured Campylobacter sp.]